MGSARGAMSPPRTIGGGDGVVQHLGLGLVGALHGREAACAVAEAEGGGDKGAREPRGAARARSCSMCVAW